MSIFVINLDEVMTTTRLEVLRPFESIGPIFVNFTNL